MASQVPVVGLRESDRPYLQVHFLCLGPEDLRRRFGVAMSPQALRDYVSRIDFVHDRLFAVQGPEGSIIAVAHVTRASGVAQIGVTVLPGWRGRGIGAELVARATAWLREIRATLDRTRSES